MDRFDERISLLRKELRTYGQEICSNIFYINSNEKHGSLSLKEDPIKVLQVLHQDISDLLDCSKTRSDNVLKFKRDIEECTSLLELLHLLTSILEIIKEIELSMNQSNLLSACEKQLNLNEVLMKLPSKNSEVGSGRVCNILRRECQILNNRLNAKLKRHVKNCIKVEFGRITVLKYANEMEDRVPSLRMTLSNAWDGLKLTGKYQEMMDNILISIWTDVIKPLWRVRKNLIPLVSKEVECSEISIDVVDAEPVAIGPSTREQDGMEFLGPCRCTFPQFLEMLSSVLTFIWSEIFFSDKELCREFGKMIHRPPMGLAANICNTMIALMPRNEKDILTFQKAIEKSVKDFENRLKVLDFSVENEIFKVTSSSFPCTSLSSAATTEFLISQLGNLRRREVVSRARELVIGDYHNTMLAVGNALEDEPSTAGNIGDPNSLLDQSASFSFQALQFESCQVSLASCRLLQHIHETLKQICSGNVSPNLAHVLFHSCRDCLELFISIVPVKFSELIENDARMGAVFFNDCCYIAHNTTILTHSYRKELGKICVNLKDALGFLDFIPRFRELGEKVLLNHVDIEAEVLRLLVTEIRICCDENHESANLLVESKSENDGYEVRPGSLFAGSLRMASSIASGVKSKSKAKSAIDCEMSSRCINNCAAASAVVEHVQKFCNQLLNVLQTSVHERILGYIIETVIRLVMEPILKADCITEAAASDITKILRILQNLKFLAPSEALVMERSVKTLESHVLNHENGYDQSKIASISGSWLKFVALSDLLEYSLSDIADALPRRKFSYFTGKEMIGLIKALFEDSPRRKSVLVAILEMST